MFKYLCDKILRAEWVHEPFPHLEIHDFLSPEHLDNILQNSQIHFPRPSTNDELYGKLCKEGWKIQKFPGCVNSWEEYTRFTVNKKITTKDPVEGMGITFRLNKINDEFVKKLIIYLNGDEFHNCLKQKFNIIEETSIISAIQKNLSGYEISPHPDIRSKCLTYLLNINKNEEFEQSKQHTQLLKFKNNYKHVESHWSKNITQRCWVPWDWCDKIKEINKNNTLIIFHPQSNPASLHAIKLNYDHLKEQRTQIYGNLMYKRRRAFKDEHWRDLIK